jgi:membrane protease subunit (stomatin/prohibitin family)
VVGTQGRFTTREIEDYLKDVIVARLTDVLGEQLDCLLDLPARYDELADATKARVAGDFEQYGLELVDLFFGGITPPEEVQKLIDERSGMGAVGDMDRYVQYQTARALRDAANKEGGGGAAAAGIGLGMGAGLGASLPGMIARATSGQSAHASPHAAQDQRGEPAHADGATRCCSRCQTTVAHSSTFCTACGSKLAPARFCGKCGGHLPEDARFCGGCGQKQE